MVEKNEQTKETALTEIGQNLPSIDWKNKEGLDLVKSIVAKDCTETEFKYLFYMASKYGLDPLKKEIWSVKFKDKPVMVFASRAGWLKIAHDSGQFDGIETTVEFEKESENNKITYINKAKKPYSATCVIHKKGCSHSFSETVYFSEYDKKQALWITMPVTMIKKVAEVQCLRKTFSVSGLYSPDEMPSITEENTNGNETV